MNDAPVVTDTHRITSIAELEALYGKPAGAAVTKEIDHLNGPYRTFIEKAPFVAIASAGEGGLDCTPRGDPAGFVRIVDDRTLLIPDRRGNNRIDTLRNIVETGRVGLLFLIPGVGETLRVNGRAHITTDPALCATFEMQRQIPKSLIVVEIDRVYFQCTKALVRSKLWDPASQVPRASVPSAGQMVAATTEGFDGAAYDIAYPERIKQTIY
ncbi:MAG: pyridoxamine 5'-phosphate oxidase family protein [Hyphomicrobium sp.]|nr:pyridoxamine 5'-phosphate oxidase family protein [Hyphomicrobium sp.]MBN9276159.1 pyridoxamine 5'-phosphate oxidase family protein [Hyphomicrobium sp.]